MKFSLVVELAKMATDALRTFAHFRLPKQYRLNQAVDKVGRQPNPAQHVGQGLYDGSPAQLGSYRRGCGIHCRIISVYDS
jgi:hypothetical protein